MVSEARKSSALKAVNGDSVSTLVIPSEAVTSFSVLTISVKKADIDAYAQGDQQYEQFLKKIQKIDY